jgi:23S rRNA (uracil1939-C5)-methyltransferase
MNTTISLNPEIASAPTHATPPCPHFGPCGGCQLQHLTYTAQLDKKAGQLRMYLDGARLPLPELQIHPSGPLAYRNRIRLTLSEFGGQLRAGYIRNPDPSYESGPAFLPITQCPIAAPILWRATQALLDELTQRPDPWRKRAPFTLDQVELFTTPDDSPTGPQLQIGLFLRTSAKSLPGKFTAAFTALCESLHTQVPALAGAGIYLLPPAGRSRRVEQPRPGPTWGVPGLNYVIPSQLATSNQQLATVLWVPRTAFFQVNRFLLPELVSLVVANRAGVPASSESESEPEPESGPTSHAGTAWDLYAGVGLFTRALAPHFERITAVEVAEPAFTALASTRLPNRHAVKSTTLDFLQAAVLQRDRPSLIVLDPPRTGAGPEVCELLGRIAAPTVIYVSCSPETLPADLATLAASGYTVAALHLLDLFPQTTHIETVAVLTR